MLVRTVLLALAGMLLSAMEPWRYEARLAADSKVLSVEGWLPAGVDKTFSVEDGAEPSVTSVEMERNGKWSSVDKGSDAWYPPIDQPLHFRYKFIFAAAKSQRGLNRISQRGPATIASPAMWLLRPWKAEGKTPIQIHCILPAGFCLVTGLATSADGASIVDTYDHVDYSPYTAFGPFQVDRSETAGVRLEVATLPSSLAVTAADLRAWCENAVANLGSVFHAFPDRRLVVLVSPSNGTGVVFGSTIGTGGPSVSILLGRTATKEDLRQDWVLTHECIHLAHPGLPRINHWFEEGLATYLEPLMRARRGVIGEQEVWKNFTENLPLAQRDRESVGLDQDPSWAATYWGGTLFFLLADVQIRERSGNRKSLDDALREILHQGGNHEARWTLDKVLEIGDRAVGGHVLRNLHQRMGAKGGRVDLKDFFQRLGVEPKDGHVAFDDTAPLAALRRSLTAPN